MKDLVGVDGRLLYFDVGADLAHALLWTLSGQAEWSSGVRAVGLCGWLSWRDHDYRLLFDSDGGGTTSISHA